MKGHVSYARSDRFAAIAREDLEADRRIAHVHRTQRQLGNFYNNNLGKDRESPSDAVGLRGSPRTRPPPGGRRRNARARDFFATLDAIWPPDL